MKQEILTKCGYRCDLCLAYKPNVENIDQRQLLSDGWFNLYGFRIEPQNIICEGCISCEDPILIDTDCPVRPCVIDKGIDNCTFCDDFICDKLKQRIVERQGIEMKLNRKLTDTEYELFIKPYESMTRLEKIRNEKI